MKVICDISAPTPIAYQDVFESGDEWVKIQGCESCSTENRRKCCNNCHRLTRDLRCDYQIPPIGSAERKSSEKPWNCIVKPYPSSAVSYCALKFKCIKGSNIGKIRCVCDPGGILQG